MSVYVSLHQLLLSQMGYLLFYELEQSNANIENIMHRLQILQNAIEQIKSFQHNNKHFDSMIKNFDFDLDEEELNELKNVNHEDDKSVYLHPFGFGMWAQEQTFIDLQWTGTMDDSETTKDLWRQLTGNAFIKQWKKKKITKEHILSNHQHSDNDNKPFFDISISNNSVVKASDFQMSLCQNRIIQIQIPMPSNSDSSNCRKSRPSVDHGINGLHSKKSTKSVAKKKKSTTFINLFDTVMNQNTLRIACCILWKADLAQEILSELMSNPAFNVDGMHKKIEEEISPISTTDLSIERPISIDVYDENGFMNLPMVASITADRSILSAPSVASTPTAMSVTISMSSRNTAYTGHGYEHLERDMDEEEIYKYLMKMDYSDKKNPVKYEWKLMVDALNAFQLKVVSIDDYTDNDILSMVNRMEEGLVNSIHDQRSGLIKVCCHLFVLIAQYRTLLFFEEDFFKFWVVCLLRKCANRDKVRTQPAHTACSMVINCILSYYLNNKDNSKEFSLGKLREMFVIFSSLWTPNKIDPLWMKQMKSVTQFIKNISLMIHHTAKLHAAAPNKVDKLLSLNESECVVEDEKKNNDEPIENEDIKQMQVIAFELFKLFTLQPHKEARECAIDLLINLYRLEKERTFEFAKEHFVKRELIDYLKKVKKLNLLSDEHKKYLKSINGSPKKRKGKNKKRKDGKNNERSSIRDRIRRLKKQNKQNVEDAVVENDENKNNNNVETKLPDEEQSDVNASVINT